MNKNEQTESETETIDLKLDHQSSPIVDERSPTDNLFHKTARLAKLSLLVTVLGLGGLGYLHLADKASTEDAIANSKTTLKKEILAEVKADISTSPQISNLAEKNAELDVKIDSYAGQISNLEMKIEQLQGEIQKNANLRNKIAELEASLKKSKVAAKPAPKKNTKASASKKAPKKGRK